MMNRFPVKRQSGQDGIFPFIFDEAPVKSGFMRLLIYLFRYYTVLALPALIGK
ncbi:hypothetical protein [Xenorhabdus vietnamensis]|uniref:hypothetical protein n=1 Tax=Xenorhabdus vietnamensis TaxID=351656 RepID=UPI00142DD061|nr:hypothetical protein [Xenorhabdus vietnamensis]